MESYTTAQQVLSLAWEKNPKLRNRAGVYRVVERKTHKLIYVGQASNLTTRLSPSIHPIYRKEKHDLYVLFVDNKDERGWMEYSFILLLKPTGNTRQGQLHTRISHNTLSNYYANVFERK